MSNFQTQEINVGTVVLGDRSLSNGQYGEKKSHRYVEFDLKFSGIPKVSVSINFFHTTNASNQNRVRVITQNITPSGMDVFFTTWDSNSVYDMTIDYVAVYNPKFKNVNNNIDSISNQNTNYKNNFNESENQQSNENYHPEDDYYNQEYQPRSRQQQQQKRLQQQKQQQQIIYNQQNDYNQTNVQNQSANNKNINYINFTERNLTIKSNKFNNYLRDNNGKGDMSPTARANETWIITPISNNNNGEYYIHNKHNHYLSSVGDRVLVVDQKNNDTSTIWKITLHNNRVGVYSIQNSKNSNYLSATDKSEVKTNVKQINSWEEFSFNFVQ